jgi:hypothetical protein
MDEDKVLGELSLFAEESKNKLERDCIEMSVDVKVNAFIRAIGMKDGEMSVLSMEFTGDVCDSPGGKPEKPELRENLARWISNWSNISHNGMLVRGRSSCVQQGPCLN